MYLNFILTVLCIILLTFLVGIIYFWKKYVKKFLKINLSKNISPNQNSFKMLESLKMMSDLMKKTPKNS